MSTLKVCEDNKLDIKTQNILFIVYLRSRQATKITFANNNLHLYIRPQLHTQFQDTTVVKRNDLCYVVIIKNTRQDHKHNYIFLSCF